MRLECPARGLFREHAWTNKSHSRRRFARLGKNEEFREYLFSQPKYAGLRTCGDEKFKRDTLRDAMKASNFVRFLVSQDPTLLPYTIDYNFKRDGEWATNGWYGRL